LITEEKSRPRTGVREAVLFEMDRFQKQIKKDQKWSKQEKEELLKFLGVQAMNWGSLSDDLGSRSVRKAKEKNLLETWQKFIEGMEFPRPQGKTAKGKKGKDKEMKKEAGLEGERSTPGTIIQGDLKILSHEIQTPVGTDSAGRQTVLHEEAAGEQSNISQSNDTEDLEQRKLKQ